MSYTSNRRKNKKTKKHVTIDSYLTHVQYLSMKKINRQFIRHTLCIYNHVTLVVAIQTVPTCHARCLSSFHITCYTQIWQLLYIKQSDWSIYWLLEAFLHRGFPSQSSTYCSIVPKKTKWIQQHVPSLSHNIMTLESPLAYLLSVMSYV